MTSSSTDVDYYHHLRNIIDAAIASIGALYENGERSRAFTEACRKVDRSARLLKAARRATGEDAES